MNVNQLTSSAFTLLILISFYFMARITFRNDTDIQFSSLIRFIGLIFIHLHGIVVMVQLFYLQSQQFYYYSLLNLQTSLINSIIMVSVEIYLHRIVWVDVKETVNNGGNTLEMTYLQIYLLIFVISILSLGFCIVYFAVVSIFCKPKRPQNFKVVLVDYILQSDLEPQWICSICYTKVSQITNRFVQLKRCRHRFHFKCLDDWVQLNQTCPIDRTSLLEEELNIPFP